MQKMKSMHLAGALTCGRQTDLALSWVKVEGHGCASVCRLNGDNINYPSGRWVTIWLGVCSGQQEVVGCLGLDPGGRSLWAGGLGSS